MGVVSFRPFVRRRRRCPLISARPDLPSTPTILVRRPYHLVSFPSTVLLPRLRPEYYFTTSSPSRVLFYVHPPRSTPFCLSFSTLTFWFDLWFDLPCPSFSLCQLSPLSPDVTPALSSAPSSALMFVLSSFVSVLPPFIVFSLGLRNLFYVLKILWV